eukprot:TRINITY_DN2211_c0_g1_i10.p1 TRINITY_DN2211_c0_g1~~TRINITY_DN2211_c0_g1_i10.p1  ORF type:complete len:747 (-),score=69.80 TRINITY_DN2211_c0_g1_i10:194-2434(-)
MSRSRYRTMLKLLVMCQFLPNTVVTTPQFNFQQFQFTTPGPLGRDFSNFVDLPSQRLQSSVPSAGLAASNSIDPNCALVIPGYEYCITYQVVDSAFYSALELLRVPLKIEIGDTFDRDEINNLAEVIQEATRIIAQTYGLNQAVVFDSLSLIDTSRTMISRYCPLSLQHRQCKLSRYREIDGTCNNLENPLWGSAMMAFSRFLPFSYGDGIGSPRLSVSGHNLPSPRMISSLVHSDKSVHEYAISILFVAWGQFIDHDITLTAETHDVKCCQGPNITHPACLPIQIPHNDPFYSRYRQGCMNFVRSRAGLRAGCKLGPREQFNQISSVIDANTVYSNEPETIRKLRTYVGGKMKTLPVFSNLGLKDLLPLNLENPDRGCIRPNRNVFCFFTGDPRVSEQTVLSLIHTLFIREHNRITDELHYINPHWSDETLFQETRHIVAAIVQHITLHEFLPLVLGKQGMHEHGLTPYTHGYFDGYNKDINPSAASGFTTAAFRFGHSLLPATIERWSRSHQFVGTQRLSEMLQQPYDLFKPGWADQYLLGMLNQVAQAMDDSVTEQVTNHLFEEPGRGFGMDLAALNIQRGREHGIPSFNRWREWCGLKPFKSWHDLTGVMFNSSLVWYPRMYESPEDIDLWSGGVSEIPMDGALLGPTFTCIIGRQFSNLRAGDRFWYENYGWPSSFTVEQLEQIRLSSLARLICDNSDGIETIQLRAMLLPDYKINPRLSCYSNEIPKLNLAPWKDIGYYK